MPKPIEESARAVVDGLMAKLKPAHYKPGCIAHLIAIAYITGRRHEARDTIVADAREALWAAS